MATDNTRLALMRAAEKLFAERGVDQVSLGEITQAADQKNRSAIQYHFGDKRALIEASLERHSDPIQSDWMAVLTVMEEEGPISLHTLVKLFVRPLVAKLDDTDNGPEYINICAQLVASPSYPLMKMEVTWAPGARKIADLITKVIDIPIEVKGLRMQRVAGVLYQSIALYHRTGEVPRELFVADLIDSLVGLISAPSSEATRRSLPPS